MMKAHSFVRENVPRVLIWAKEKTSMEDHLIKDHCVLTTSQWKPCNCVFLKLITSGVSSRL